MKMLITVIFILVGLINLYPAIGMLSSEQLVALYGIEFVSSEHLILMRHRAVMFGLLGVLILCAAFKPAMRPLASIAALVSMISFIVIALAYADYNLAAISSSIYKVVIADIIASIALLAIFPFVMRHYLVQNA